MIKNNNMKKLAVVISSFSGMLKEEVEKQGMYLLPLQIIIDDNQQLEGYYDNNEKLKLVNEFQNAETFSTSLPPLGLIEEQMKKLSSEYDDVLYLPIDSQLSSTYNVLLNNSKQYKNVYVFNNRLNGSALFRIGKKSLNMYNNENASIEMVLDYLNWYNNNSIGYIVPKELKTFIKSGRLKGIKKAILSSMNLSIIIEVGEVLKSIGISRTKKLATNKIISRILEFIEIKKMKLEEFEFSIISAYDKFIANIFKDELFKELKVKPNYEEDASIVTMMHTGYGACYIGINPKIK